jgi:hypothetical protein
MKKILAALAILAVIAAGTATAVFQQLQPEEYEKLTKEELYAWICKGLFVDEAAVSGEYRHKALAQYLERAMYVCPDCGLSVFESSADLITCKTCRRQARYLPTRELEGVGQPFPFRFVADWYDYQCSFVNKLDLGAYMEQPMYRDEAGVYEVLVYRRKNRLRPQAQIELYGDRVVIDGELALLFDEIYGAAVLGRNKLNLYHKDRIYQIKGGKRFNALKYVNIYHRYKNISRGEPNGEFLGL